MKANIYDIIDLIKSLIENGKISGQEICKRFEQQVLELKNPILSYEFAQIPGADVKAHGKIVIENGDIDLNYRFAQIPGADVQSHAAVIFNSENEKYCDLTQKYLYEHINPRQRDDFDIGIKLTRIKLLIDNELNSQN